MNNLKKQMVSVFFLGILTSECFSAVTLPKKIEGLYPQKAQNIIKVKGSKAHSSKSKNLDSNYNDVFLAIEEIVISNDMAIEKKNKRLGMIIGKGILPTICGSVTCNMGVSFAVYVEKINDEVTKLTIAMDSFGFDDTSRGMSDLAGPGRRTVHDSTLDGLKDSGISHSAEEKIIVSSGSLGRASVDVLKEQASSGLRDDSRTAISKDNADADAVEELFGRENLKTTLGYIWKATMDAVGPEKEFDDGKYNAVTGGRVMDTPEGVDNADDLKGTAEDKSEEGTLLDDPSGPTGIQDKTVPKTVLQEVGRSDSHTTNDREGDTTTGSNVGQIVDKPKTVIDMVKKPVIPVPK